MSLCKKFAQAHYQARQYSRYRPSFLPFRSPPHPIESGVSDDTENEDESAEPSLEELTALLKQLRAEHRRADDEIKALYEIDVTDMLKIRRMKKIKLAIKDQITYLENQITPDIIA